MNSTEKGKLFKETFGTEAGQKVLKELERVANQTKVDSDNPNSNACVYRVAQQALIQTIKNQLKPTERKFIGHD